MKNINKNGHAAFYPCGLTIESDRIFASARNLGLSLMGALTGNPTETVEINRADISVGLGCFGLVGINCADYQDGDCLDDLDVDSDWSISSCIRYKLFDDRMTRNIIAEFPMLILNIFPDELLRGDRSVFSAIQLFGPDRLLRKIRPEDCRFEPCCEEHNSLDVGNYIEGLFEPNDAILTPSEMEFDLYWDEDNPAKKFRILLNMITTFASVLSFKLMGHGLVDLSYLHGLSSSAKREFYWLDDGRIGPAWRPTLEEMKEFIKVSNLPKSEVHPEVRKLLWPEEAADSIKDVKTGDE